MRTLNPQNKGHGPAKRGVFSGCPWRIPRACPSWDQNIGKLQKPEKQVVPEN